jgi:ABC-2 type transport system ATP-binding protein
MARGRLLREGDLENLISVDNQTQFVVENAPPQLAAEIEALVAKSGATLVATRRPQRTLEKVFLEVTSEPPK